MTVDELALRQRLQTEYALFAENPRDGEHGRERALRLGYPAEWLDQLPPSLVEPFAGTGNPFAWGPPRPGSWVLDVGCGAGLDSILAAAQVGPRGHVIGVDLTPDLVWRATRAAERMSLRNVAFVAARAEELPVGGCLFDVAISNGMLLFAPDKEAVLCEIRRCLVPGGSVLLSTIVLERPATEGEASAIDSWVQ